MQVLVWAGAAMTLAGLAGIIWCILAVRSARKKGLDEEGMRLALQKIVAVNLAAFGVSALGLMAVVAGLILA